MARRGWLVLVASVAAICGVCVVARRRGITILLSLKVNGKKGTLFKPLSIEDYENEAQERLEPLVAGYFGHTAGDGLTYRQNRLQFAHIQIRPRVLVDVSSIDLSTTILGHHVKLPIGVGVTPMHKLAHPDGECGTARAAAAVGALYVVNGMLSSDLLDDIAASSAETQPPGLRFLQVYIFQEREITERVTCDHPTTAVQAKWVPQFMEAARKRGANAPAVPLPNLGWDGRFDSPLPGNNDGSLTWTAIEWVRTLTPLPIVAKGIMSAEDALLAIQHGVKAIIVSNHGARQFDSGMSSIEALPAIASAVKDQLEIYLDSGVRTGSDVFKALAVGARAVLLGRPILWGLACAGAPGVSHVLSIMGTELEHTMAHAGCRSIADIKPTCLITRPQTLILPQHFIPS